MMTLAEVCLWLFVAAAIAMIISLFWMMPSYCDTFNQDRLSQGATPHPYCMNK